MIGDPWVTLYYQRYNIGDEVAYCPDCFEIFEELHELVVDDPSDEYNFSMCPECHRTFNFDQIHWIEAEKDSEHNIPESAWKYHALFVIKQGEGNFENIKYRTYLQGTVDEFDKLQTLIRELKPLSANTLIRLIEGYSELQEDYKRLYDESAQYTGERTQ